MSRPLPSTLRALTTALLVIAPLASPSLAQMPTTVYAYNHNTKDGYDNNAEAWIWQELGLLDADGNPIAVPEAQKIRNADGDVIGYRSADGTKEAYDLNSTATADSAWQRVANDGTFHIAKHGVSFEADDMDYEGGGITLDGSKVYGGFKAVGGTGAGTGVDFGNGVYPITPRPGAGIQVDLNSCWSSKDPDGAQPEFESVEDSIAGIPGVGGVTGQMGTVQKRANSSLVGGTGAERNAAWEKLREQARKDGYPAPPKDGGARGATTDSDIGEWIADLPFDTRGATVQALIDMVVTPAGTVKLRVQLGKNPAPSFAAGVGGVGPSASGGEHTHHERLGGFLPTSVVADHFGVPVAELVAPPGALPIPSVFVINQFAGAPAPPVGLELVSGTFDFVHRGLLPILGPLGLELAHTGLPQLATLHRYDETTGAWVELTMGVSSAPNGAMIALVDTLGVHAVFHPEMLPTFCNGDGGDGAGCTSCPCGNNAPSGTLGGCLNSSGTSAQLAGTGVPSLTTDTLRFDVANANASTFAVLISGVNQLPLVGPCPPGSGTLSISLDGLRCAGQGFLRHGTRALDGDGQNTSPWGPPGAPAAGILASSGLVAGETRYFQVFYREAPALGCGTGQNTTNAVTVTVLP